jgi:hypothetical protein
VFTASGEEAIIEVKLCPLRLSDVKMPGIGEIAVKTCFERKTIVLEAGHDANRSKCLRRDCLVQEKESRMPKITYFF